MASSYPRPRKPRSEEELTGHKQRLLVLKQKNKCFLSNLLFCPKMVRHDQFGQGQGQDQFLNTNLTDPLWLVQSSNNRQKFCNYTHFKITLSMFRNLLFISFDLTSTPVLILGLLDGDLASVSPEQNRESESNKSEAAEWRWSPGHESGFINEHFKCLWVTHRATVGGGFMLGLGAWECTPLIDHIQSFHTC